MAGTPGSEGPVGVAAGGTTGASAASAVAPEASLERFPAAAHLADDSPVEHEPLARVESKQGAAITVVASANVDMSPACLAMAQMAARGAGEDVAEGPALVQGQVPSPAAPDASIRSGRAPEAACAASEDREEFTGLRIEGRCVPAAQWAEEIRGRGRHIVPWSRLTELARRRQNRDRVVIGVLYERSGQHRLANGESYSSWGLTDLAQPKPRQLQLHLRGQAFVHWRSGQAAASVRRGSIFAVLNPVLVQEGVGGAAGGEPVARVERAAQLHKLGECPSLGTCSVRRCQAPCNADIGERFCAVHLSVAYADKRVSARTGGVDPGVAALLKKCPGIARKTMSRRVKLPESEDDDGNDNENATKILSTDVAVEFDNRRFHRAEANDSYVRSIRAGVVSDGKAMSRTPVLGRGLEGETAFLELDFATLASGEKRKAERMLELRSERVVRPAPPGRPRSGAPVPAASATKRAPSSRAEEPAPKRALAELMSALADRRMARRANAPPAPGAGLRPTAPGAQVPTARVAMAGSTATLAGGDAKDAGDAMAECAAGAAASVGSVASSVEADLLQTASAAAPAEAIDAVSGQRRVDALLHDLAGSAGEGLLAALAAAGQLPVAAVHGPAGQQLYNAVGRLTLQGGRADVRRAALCLRRRWRAASDEAEARKPEACGGDNDTGVVRAAAEKEALPSASIGMEEQMGSSGGASAGASTDASELGVATCAAAEPREGSALVHEPALPALAGREGGA